MHKIHISRVCYQQLVCSTNLPTLSLADKHSSPNPFEVPIFNPALNAC